MASSELPEDPSETSPRAGHGEPEAEASGVRFVNDPSTDDEEEKAHPSFGAPTENRRADSSSMWTCRDIWTLIAYRAHSGQDLVRLGAVCTSTRFILTDELIWRVRFRKECRARGLYLCPSSPYVPNFPLKQIYVSSFVERPHPFIFHGQLNEHLIRIGTQTTPFCIHSQSLYVCIERVVPPNDPPEGLTDAEMLGQHGYFFLNGLKPGMRTGGCFEVRCLECPNLPVCSETTIFEIWHCELFLAEHANWHYEVVVNHTSDIIHWVYAALIDRERLKNHMGALINTDWWYPEENLQPYLVYARHGAGVTCNLIEPEAIRFIYEVKRAGEDGDVVAVRVSWRPAERYASRHPDPNA